jgi:glutaconate CoA-transferase subunit B
VLPLSIGDGELCDTAVTTVSVPEMFRYWLQGGRVTVGFLGAAQIDRFGNINTTVIGDYDQPENPPARRWRRTGDRLLLRRNLHHAQAVQARHGRQDRLRTPASATAKAATIVSRMGIATKGPTLMVTDLAVWKPDPVTREFTVVSIASRRQLSEMVQADLRLDRFGFADEARPRPRRQPGSSCATLRDLKARTEAAHTGGRPRPPQAAHNLEKPPDGRSIHL